MLHSIPKNNFRFFKNNFCSFRSNAFLQFCFLIPFISAACSLRVSSLFVEIEEEKKLEQMAVKSLLYPFIRI